MRDCWNAPEEVPWLGNWFRIVWAQEQADLLLSRYTAAQEVIDVASDAPDLWIPAGGERLVLLLRDWDKRRAERQRIDDQIREHLRSLREDDVPPLISG